MEGVRTSSVDLTTYFPCALAQREAVEDCTYSSDATMLSCCSPHQSGETIKVDAILNGMEGTAKMEAVEARKDERGRRD